MGHLGHFFTVQVFQILAGSLPTAKEGNVFRSVCHSVHRGSAPKAGGLPPKSASEVPGRRDVALSPKGGSTSDCEGGGGSASCGSHCSGLYDSCRNAFFF